jgi:hypothetical protein
MFLAEAKRLWELQVVKGQHRNLPSIQAAILINVVYNVCGLDKLGNVYGVQGLLLAQEIGLFGGNAHIQPERLRCAANFSAWALFNMDSLFAWYFHKEPILHRPPKADLPEMRSQRTWYTEVWLRYPADQYATPSHYGLFFRAMSQFRIILNEVCHAAFSEGSEITADHTRAFGRRLTEWYDQLPTALFPKYIVLPAHFLLQWVFSLFGDLSIRITDELVSNTTL